MDAAEPKPKALAFPNGTGAIKKHSLPLLRPPSTADSFLYRECLKNHAASLGGHALDGCGEFMPSPASNPSDPSSLKCAACGCHRNFHRRVSGEMPTVIHHRRSAMDEVRVAAAEMAAADEDEDDNNDNGHDEDDEEEDDDDDDDDVHEPHEEQQRCSFGYAQSPSAPHMLLALSSGVPSRQPPGPQLPVLNTTPLMSAQSGGMSVPRKRFRTKFSPEQKQRMQELSERLGWRLQKRDEALVDEWCREIGVGKGVFKVWMHNNKHTFLGTGRRGSTAGAGAGASGAAAAAAAVDPAATSAYLAAAAAAAAAASAAAAHSPAMEQSAASSSIAAGLSIRHAMNGASPSS